MEQLPLPRRELLASIPALLVAPAALAQAAPPGQAAPGGARPNIRPKGGQEGLTLPFAMAACWADDFGALSDLRLHARLDCTIGVRTARQPTNDDESCAMLLSIGAATECCAMLASASMAGSGILYMPPKESGDLVQISVRIGQVKKGSNPDALRSAAGIFARPDPTGAFDPAWTPAQAMLDKVRLSMSDQNCTAVAVPADQKDAFLKSLRALAKASPAIAKSIGAPELWEDGCTPVIVGRGPASSMQTAITSGRAMERAVLIACQEEASLDLRVILPGVFEAASSQGAEATAAAKALSLMLALPGFEPIAVGRLGKLVAPKARATPPYMRILEPSLEAPEAKPAAPKPADG
jgi:hypothetical protein